MDSKREEKNEFLIIAYVSSLCSQEISVCAQSVLSLCSACALTDHWSPFGSFSQILLLMWAFGLILHLRQVVIGVECLSGGKVVMVRLWPTGTAYTPYILMTANAAIIENYSNFRLLLSLKLNSYYIWEENWNLFWRANELFECHDISIRLSFCSQNRIFLTFDILFSSVSGYILKIEIWENENRINDNLDASHSRIFSVILEFRYKWIMHLKCNEWKVLFVSLNVSLNVLLYVSLILF